MSSPYYSGGSGPGSPLQGSSGSSSSSGLTASTGSRPLVPYPNPFFDIAGTYMPQSMKSLYVHIRHFVLTNPIVGTVTHKMAAYPVTNVLIESADEELRERWREFFEQTLRIRRFLVEANLDREAFGTAYVSIFYPFRKYLRCTHCKKLHEIQAVRQHYRFRSFQYILACPACGHTGEAVVEDRAVRNARGVRLIRWDPSAITPKVNQITQEWTYYYEIPNRLRNEIILERRKTLETTPHVFIEALRQGRSITIDPANIFHYRRTSISHPDWVGGVPRLLNVLKQGYLSQLLYKSQEVLANESIIPLNIFFPQPGSTSADPYSMVPLTSWMDVTRDEFGRFRRDKGYSPILPLPIGYQRVGGDGRMLMPAEAIRSIADELVNGMGVPLEFYRGGLSFSGSSVSMRMMENEFLGNREEMHELLHFLVERLSVFLNWRPVKARMSAFRMADDLQRASFDLQLNMQGKISDATLLQSRDYDLINERRLQEEERKGRYRQQREQQLEAARSAGEAMLVQTRYQVQATQMQMEAQAKQQASAGQPPSPEDPAAAGQLPPEEQPMGEAPPPEEEEQQGFFGSGGFQMDIEQTAHRVVGYLHTLPPEQKYEELARLRGEQPEVYRMVTQIMAGQGRGSADLPLPEQRAPRRGPATQLV